MITLQIIDRTGHTEILERPRDTPAAPGTLTREEIEARFSQLVAEPFVIAAAGPDFDHLLQVADFREIPEEGDISVLIVSAYAGG